MSRHTHHTHPSKPTPWHLKPFVWLIKLYQLTLSPLKTALFGPSAACRFYPTCSSYAHEAVLTHGLIKGTLLALWRIMRCQPMHPGGHDPVPPKGQWRNQTNANSPTRCKHNHG